MIWVRYNRHARTHAHIHTRSHKQGQERFVYQNRSCPSVSFPKSYLKSGISSINYFIEKDDISLQYITIDNAIAAIQNFGQGCYMGKTDIESAFRLIPVHADDWEQDKVLPFGLRSAPYIFNQLSDAIEWILLNKCSISFVCHILDNFLIVEPPCPNPPLYSRCRASLLSMILTFKL